MRARSKRRRSNRAPRAEAAEAAPDGSKRTSSSRPRPASAGRSRPRRGRRSPRASAEEADARAEAERSRPSASKFADAYRSRSKPRASKPNGRSRTTRCRRCDAERHRSRNASEAETLEPNASKPSAEADARSWSSKRRCRKPSDATSRRRTRRSRSGGRAVAEERRWPARRGCRRIAAAAPAFAPSRRAIPRIRTSPLVLADMDEDLIEIFVEEGNDILDQADALVAQPARAPSDANAIGRPAARPAHDEGRRARRRHRADRRPRPRDGVAARSRRRASAVTLDRRGVESLERGFDRLHRMVARVAQAPGDRDAGAA